MKKKVVGLVSFKKGEKVKALQGSMQEERDKYTIETPKGHVLDSVGMYMNHSFSPTCEIQGMYVVALRDLEVGTEITFNYLENESEISRPFIDKSTGRSVGNI